MSRIKTQGTVISPDLVRLKSPLDVSEGTEVEVFVTPPSGERLSSKKGSLDAMLLCLEDIRLSLLVDSGIEPQSKDEVDEWLKQERASWDDEETLNS